MDKITGCANCGGVRVTGSTLCTDCLDVCHSGVRARMIALEVENRRNLLNLSVVVKEQKEQIEKLEYGLRLRTKLLQKIFEEYQLVLMDRKKDKIKIDSINRAFR